MKKVKLDDAQRDQTVHVKNFRDEGRLFRAVTEYSSDMIILTNPQGVNIYMNQAIEKNLGYKIEERINASGLEIVHPDDLQKVLDYFVILSTDTNYPVIKGETRLRHKNGTWCTFETIASNIVKNNAVEALVINHHNITERKQIENDLRESERNFRRSLDESPLGIRISTIEGETIYANRAILDMYGYDSIEELKETSIKERYTPESYAAFKERKRKRLQGEPAPPEYEISIVKKNGEIRHLHAFRKEILWNGKKQSQIIYQDITERKRAEEKLQQTLESLRNAIGTTIQVMVSVVEMRDPYTAGHQTRSADIARAIAVEMGLDQDKIDGIRMAGSIHDIGKLSIPAEILSKSTKLSEIEFSLIQEHSNSGYEMLKSVESPWPLAEIVYQHHERINGTGYPRNLKGDEILLEARILAVADVVEAMASHRPYRESLGIEAALEEIEKNKGILYDNDVADACLRLFRERGYKLT
ncbi:MAG TPA: PAS domain S-box protein [Smithella sp.]|nr:PAS domain S-box protein [Smithella sp.]